MVALSGKDQTLATPANSLIDYDGRSHSKESPKVSGYEQFREERIKANLERMQQLGIVDLSLKLKSIKPHRNINSSNRKSLSCSSPLLLSGPPRRSSRLQNVTSISYCEVRSGKRDKSSETTHDLLREEGAKPEVYTDEHEKLLGNTKMTWTLFVDGYGKDGKRIYDQIKGKTCHQCRQKTLGHRTHCSQCGMVQGQFCGDCLYMRYGENVLEANQNPNWICPVCRGICNCSLCRQAKGWAPTGPLYKKISQLGFKSVAHYLIQTRRSQNGSEEVYDSNIPLSAKRSLASLDTEPKLERKESPISNNYCCEHIKCEEKEVNEDHILNSDSSNYLKALSKTVSVDNKTTDKLEFKEAAENIVASGSTPKSKRKLHYTSEPNTDTIAGRLRQRRRMGNGILEQNGMLASLGSKDTESIAGRLRLRRRT
ncbi:hypothetical protein NMG60_11008079 [Bertholletia excelsa]